MNSCNPQLHPPPLLPSHFPLQKKQPLPFRRGCLKICSHPQRNSGNRPWRTHRPRRPSRPTRVFIRVVRLVRIRIVCIRDAVTILVPRTRLARRIPNTTTRRDQINPTHTRLHQTEVPCVIIFLHRLHRNLALASRHRLFARRHHGLASTSSHTAVLRSNQAGRLRRTLHRTVDDARRFLRRCISRSRHNLNHHVLVRLRSRNGSLHNLAGALRRSRNKLSNNLERALRIGTDSLRHFLGLSATVGSHRAGRGTKRKRHHRSNSSEAHSESGLVHLGFGLG